MTKLFNVTT